MNTDLEGDGLGLFETVVPTFTWTD